MEGVHPGIFWSRKEDGGCQSRAPPRGCSAEVAAELCRCCPSRLGLQAPPGEGSTVWFLCQPPVTWLPMKGRAGRGFHPRGLPRSATGSVPSSARHVLCCFCPGARSRSASHLRPLKGSVSRESLPACGSGSSFSSSTFPLLPASLYLSRFRGKGRDFVRLFPAES